MQLTVRELLDSDIHHIVGYFIDADPDFLRGMGADVNKLPKRKDWIRKLQLELAKPYLEKNYYYIIWLLDAQPIGHSNVNNITFGESANMHLHIWKSEHRKGGLGVQFLRQTIPLYFERLSLKKLVCEPYSENPAPNKILQKLGFQFVRTYETTPGIINFRQTVNRYELKKEDFMP